MARLLGPDDSDRLVYVLSGTQIHIAAGMTATVYAASTGGTLADILADNNGTPGAAISGSQLTVDSNGLLPQFWFPDSTDTVWVQVGSGPRTKIDAAFDPRLDASLPLAGGTLTGNVTVAAGKTVSIESDFSGGEDEGQPGQFDSTGRLNLESYQRADVNSYGEVIRIYSRRADSKQMIAWYGPTSYNMSTREPIGNDKPWAWLGAHYEANDHGSIHGHWSMETPDSTGALQTRLEIPIWNPTSGVYGMDKTTVKTNAADFNVRCSNGQELRLSAPAGNAKPITFSNSSDGEDVYRRWQVRATSEAESGSNAGTNFQIARYDDSGTFVDSPVVISRSTGNVTLGPGFIARRSSATVSSLSLNTTSLGSGQGVVAIGNADTVPSGTPTGGGVLYVESGALKYKGSSGTVTTIANA